MSKITNGIIRWSIGEPETLGDYITLREKLNGELYVSVNSYNPLENTPLNKGWQVQIADNSKIIAWCNVKNIKLGKK